MENVYIVLIIVVGVVILVFLLRDRLTSFKANVRGRRGESEIGGGLGIGAETPRQRPGTSVTRTRMIGKKQEMSVKQPGAQVDETLMKGEEQKINIDNPNEPQKSESRE